MKASILVIICIVISGSHCQTSGPIIRSGFDPMVPDTDFLTDCLTTHNTYRQYHHSVNIALNNTLIAYARSRCKRSSQYDGLDGGHDGLVGAGENIAWFGSSNPNIATCAQAVNLWYNEVKDYNFANPGFSSSTGHFTQLVWNQSTQLGCARCAGQGSQWYETYVVCNYYVPGNMGGQYGNNVFPH